LNASFVSYAGILSADNFCCRTDTFIKMRFDSRFAAKMLISVCLMLAGHTACAEEIITTAAAVMYG